MSTVEEKIAALRQQFETVRDERRTYANTATRIGNAFLSLLSYLEDSPFLRKDSPDFASKLITFLEGIAFQNGKGIDSLGNATLQDLLLETLKSPNFVQGLLEGTGFGLYKDTNGASVLEIDKLVVRLKMLISELEVRKLSYVGNDQVFSSAGSHITMAATLDSGDFRCYILADDGTTRTLNNWRIGDQAKCKTNNIQQGIYENVSDRYYWRLVVNTGTETLSDGKTYNYVDLSNVYGSLDLVVDGVTYACVGYDTSIENDIPQSGDDIVQLGSQTDKDRQYAYIIYVSEHKRVDYAGINNFDLTSHEVEKHSADGGFIKSDRFFISSASGTGESSPIVCDRGGWTNGMVCGHYDRVSYNGALWLCNVGKDQTTTEEPTETSSVWIKQVEQGGSGWRVEGFSSAGSAAYTYGQTTWEATFEVHVWRNDVEVTTTLPETRFVWSRVSEYPAGDAAWNTTHANIGTSIHVTYDELYGDTSFICEFLDDSGAMAKRIVF